MKTTIPLKVISIQQQGYHFILKIRINNKVARMVLDTGASQTVLDKNRIHSFITDQEFQKSDALSTGLGTNSMESHIAHVNKMKLGELTIKNVFIILLDLAIVNSSYEQIGEKPIDGIIGSDILMNHKAQIDF